MTAVLPRRIVEERGVAEGRKATTRFAPENVILAAD